MLCSVFFPVFLPCTMLKNSYQILLQNWPALLVKSMVIFKHHYGNKISIFLVMISTPVHRPRILGSFFFYFLFILVTYSVLGLTLVFLISIPAQHPWVLGSFFICSSCISRAHSSPDGKMQKARKENIILHNYLDS